ncbi:hypothetical protein BRADI_4g22525v3 [Brachypodium distachyon]|uniref:SWIM-type domain-containing protein n=1 Tax=Brachypodium distachyon TaxID=15368 RepID=A0A0Q3ERQ5_BRADI|nr:hypothetical protein BRADI_4g22525v3 [Brachypodium distachyon]
MDAERHLGNQVVGLPCSWTKRGEAIQGPDARISACTTSTLEHFVKCASDLDGSDVFAPTAGTTFDSRQEAYELYNLYSWKQGFGVRHGRSRINRFGYRSMHEIVCQCQGKPGKENTASCRTDCPAKIRLHRTEDHGWYVSIFNNEHNHRLSTSCDEKMHWNSHNEIDPLARDFVKNLRANNISLGKIYNIMGSSSYGSGTVPFRKQALRTLCSSIAQETMKEDLPKTVKLLQEMRARDLEMTLVVDIDENGRIKTMLWCNGRNKRDYKDFGYAITFDTTYKTNLYNMPFGLFVGVNNHFQSVIFAGVLLREETTAAFEWIFNNFLSIVDNKHPYTVLTDQCQVMRTALETAMPNSRHRWCKWHVLKSAKEKLGYVYSEHSEFKREFHELLNAVMSPDEFECRWAAILDRYKLKNNPYIDRLYENREMWVKPYFLDIFCASMTSTQRSESANSMLKQYISRRRMCTSTTPLEADAAQIYTRAMFDTFKEELYRSGWYVVEEDVYTGNYRLTWAPDSRSNDSEHNQRSFIVQIEDDGQFVSCTCGLFAHVGMICRHAIKVLLRNDILRVPQKNILRRWTVHARHNLESGGAMIQHRRADDERGFRTNVLTMVASDMVKESNSHPIFYNVAMRGLCKIRDDMKKLKEVVVLPDTNVLQEFDSNLISQVVEPPKRVGSAGRPSTVRPRSRMDYISDVKKKTRAVSSLYKPPGKLGKDDGALMEIVGSERKPLKRIVRCAICKNPGHNRSRCTQRGV